jgi:hypothetical protein
VVEWWRDGGGIILILILFLKKLLDLERAGRCANAELRLCATGV